jgi:predicted Zn-dependent peptidase
MRWRFAFCVCAVALPLAAASSSIQTIDFTEHTLKNGLRVILSEDHSAPTFSLSMTYNVGSRDERPGRSGFAHLFEHMMFQGSENVGKGEHLTVVTLNGGSANGTTNQFRTSYFETLPSNQIDLALFAEADRMRSLAITPANFANQRAAVQDERRQRIDNQAFGHTTEILQAMIFDNFSNAHATIGSMDDLNAATVQDVAAFFKTYYAPNNAVLVMVGNFDSDPLLRMIDARFGSIPQQPPPPKPDVSESPQTAERRKTVQDPLARGGRMDIAFRIPAAYTPDWYALFVASQILSGGQSSRLYETLVRDKKVAQGVSSAAQERPGPSYFSILLQLQSARTTGEAEALTYLELEKLKNTPVSDSEMEEVHIALRRNQAALLESSTANRANRLGMFAASYNDASRINSSFAGLAGVTKEDIQRVAKTYFVETNRSVLLTVPAPPPAAPAAPAGPAGAR